MNLKEKLYKIAEENNLKVEGEDLERPWGGFLVISAESLDTFIDTFFPQKAEELKNSENPLMPKLLGIDGDKRLSWQYHERRAELGTPLTEKGAYFLSETDEMPEKRSYFKKGEVVEFPATYRHRWAGVKDQSYTIIAEIWKHVDPENPSTEHEDEVRLQDDFGRS